MSKIRPQQPVIHIPSFQEYKIGATQLSFELKAFGFEVPMGMLDRVYYYTDMEGWGRVLDDLVFRSSLYKQDKFDCENYALKAMTLCAERYGLNTFGLAIGNTPAGRHGFNLFYTAGIAGEQIGSFLLWEPNMGFPCSGEPLEIGENDYLPELVLI